MISGAVATISPLTLGAVATISPLTSVASGNRALASSLGTKLADPSISEAVSLLASLGSVSVMKSNVPRRRGWDTTPNCPRTGPDLTATKAGYRRGCVGACLENPAAGARSANDHSSLIVLGDNRSMFHQIVLCKLCEQGCCAQGREQKTRLRESDGEEREESPSACAVSGVGWASGRVDKNLSGLGIFSDL